MTVPGAGRLLALAAGRALLGLAALGATACGSIERVTSAPASSDSPAPSPAPAAPEAPAPPRAPAAARPAEVLAAGDLMMEQGDYAQALSAYDEFLRLAPDGRDARRARASREAAARIVSAAAELARLRDDMAAQEREVARLRRELTAREADLGRLRAETSALRHDLGERQAELARLAAEAERLRVDLDKLKSLDVHLERRR